MQITSKLQILPSAVTSTTKRREKRANTMMKRIKNLKLNHATNKLPSSHSSKNRLLSHWNKRNKPLTSMMLRNARPFSPSRQTSSAKQISKPPNKLRYSAKKRKKRGHYNRQRKGSSSYSSLKWQR